MAKFKKRESIQEDITADDFLGKTTLPAKRISGTDDITVGLSIEDIQKSTNNLVVFRDISAKQLFAVTENDEKRAIFLSHLHRWKKHAGWIAGRLLFEIQNKIQEDYNEWAAKGEIPEIKPKITTFKQWLKEYHVELGFGESTAKEYLWLYKNVEYEHAPLGVKKSKLLNSITDNYVRGKVESEAIFKNLTYDALKQKVEYYQSKSDKMTSDAKRMASLNRMKITRERNKIIIECPENEINSVMEAIDKYKEKIWIYAEDMRK
jgi:hypothetical protein